MIKRRIYPVISFILLVLWLLLIFNMSAKTGEESAGISLILAKYVYTLPLIDKIIKFDNLHLLIRKTAHFTEYGILGLLLLNFIKSIGVHISKKAYITAFIIGVIYAALDEYHQSFVDGRGPSVIDVFIDSSGVLFFLIMVYLISTRLYERKKMLSEACS